MGPDYHKPKLWTPKQWLPQSQRSTGKVSSVPTQQAPDPNWWSVFHDKELTSLEDRLSHQNLDILRAAQTVAVSRGQLLIAGAERFPDLAASGSYSYTQFSTKQMQYILKHVGASAAGTKLGDMLTAEASDATIPLLNRWQDSLRASWEIDLWGRVRRQYEAAKAYMHATREEQRGI
ncbi:MAG: TolC family protein, partial [Acetobacter sp.]|nr:TolC family protein [Acetobacter sp.]